MRQTGIGFVIAGVGLLIYVALLDGASGGWRYVGTSLILVGLLMVPHGTPPSTPRRPVKDRLLEEHESGIRALIAESHGQPYRSFHTLKEAQAAPVAAVILEGDYGGQIFATCPARLVRCDEARLRHLSKELELLLWDTDDTDGAQLYLEPVAAGHSVAGGMGGGRVVDGVWTHEEIRQLGLDHAIRDIFQNRRNDLPHPNPAVPDDVRTGILRAYDERLDVLCGIFGFAEPDYVTTLPFEERARRQDAVIPPGTTWTRWYPATIREVARRAGRVIAER